MSAAELFLEGFSPPPPAPERRTRRRATWLTALAVVWAKRVSREVPWGRLGRALHAYQHDPRLPSRLDFYIRCQRAAGREVNLFLFAQHFEEWGDPEERQPGETDMVYSGRMFELLDSPVRLRDESDEEYAKRMAFRGVVR